MSASIDMDDYSARYAEQYDAHTFETELVRIRRAQVLDAMRRYPHRRVLEIGCGLEPLFMHVDDWEKFLVVEPSSRFVAHARALAADKPAVRVIEGFFGQADLDLGSEAPEFIAVSSLLHEVPDAQALLAAVRETSGPATVAHFNVPNVRSFHRLLALEMGLIDDLFEPSEMERRFQRQSRYDVDSLIAIVEREGFRVLRSGTYFVKPFTHAQMQAMLEREIIDERVLLGLSGMVRHLPNMGAEAFVDVQRR